RAGDGGAGQPEEKAGGAASQRRRGEELRSALYRWSGEARRREARASRVLGDAAALQARRHEASAAGPRPQAQRQGGGDPRSGAEEQLAGALVPAEDRA